MPKRALQSAAWSGRGRRAEKTPMLDPAVQGRGNGAMLRPVKQPLRRRRWRLGPGLRRVRRAGQTPNANGWAESAWGGVIVGPQEPPGPARRAGWLVTVVSRQSGRGKQAGLPGSLAPQNRPPGSGLLASALRPVPNRSPPPPRSDRSGRGPPYSRRGLAVPARRAIHRAAAVKPRRGVLPEGQTSRLPARHGAAARPSPPARAEWGLAPPLRQA